MLAAIADKVSEENLSVENITTEIRLGEGGRRDFVINCDCTASRKLENPELDALFGDFSDLKKELNFDVIDIRVHME